VSGAPASGAPAAAPLLALEGVDSFYGPVQVHHSLSLEVGKSEIVCLLGGNASGKSTTMRLILGLMEPRAGDIRWKGESIARLPTPERIRLGLASVPEARRIFPDMSVEENLLMGAYARRGPRSAMKRDMEGALELFPRLRERFSQAGGTLSGGEQQMLAIARALMSGPELVCMDEPTMGLSPLFVEKVLETIGELGRRGVSVFMVEQNAQQALRIAHRGYVLQNGRLVLQGGAKELLGDPRIRDAYLGGEQMSSLRPFTPIR
jgi:branched-chain amino acid transport system ATP-binding protein